MLCHTAAPFTDLPLDNGKPLQLGPGTYLTAVPAWVRKQIKVSPFLSKMEQKELGACERCFVCSYEAQPQNGFLSVGGREEEPSERVSPHGMSVDLIYFANFAFWLEQLPSPGFTFVFHRRYGVARTPARHDRFLYHETDTANPKHASPADLELVRRHYTSLCKVARDSAPWAALRAATSALPSRRPEIRHLLLWIALEALFGADTEITHRLSQRLAFFAGKDREDVRRLFIQAKQGYNARCKIAHGAWGQKTLSEEAYQHIGVTEMLVRRAFVALLRSEEATTRFYGKQRDAFLDELPFTKVF